MLQKTILAEILMNIVVISTFCRLPAFCAPSANKGKHPKTVEDPEQKGGDMRHKSKNR